MIYFLINKNFFLYVLMVIKWVISYKNVILIFLIVKIEVIRDVIILMGLNG